MNNPKSDIGQLIQQLAAACIRHQLRDAGRPSMLVDSELYQVHAVIALEQESTEVCIRRGLIDVLIDEFGPKGGEATARYMLSLALCDGEITAIGLNLIKSVLLSGIEARLETGEAL